MISLCQRGIVSIVLLVSLTAELSHAGSEWNQEARDYVLQVHNDLRAGEGGCHIDKLVYDQELERQAQQWAEGCRFQHELKDGRGENLAWNSNKNSEKELIGTACINWFNEKKTYSYGQYSCSTSRSCHYTQMVWGKTSRIGCYSTRCGYLTGAAQNAWYLVCFYTPKGNWNGEKPFEKGCLSPCREGQTEENKLCIGEAKGGNGRENNGACDDDQGNCQLWANNGQCTANVKYMKLHCNKSCQFCVSTEAEACEDKNTSCSNWMKKGECQRNPTYMAHNCVKSCGKC